MNYTNDQVIQYAKINGYDDLVKTIEFNQFTGRSLFAFSQTQIEQLIPPLALRYRFNDFQSIFYMNLVQQPTATTAPPIVPDTQYQPALLPPQFNQQDMSSSCYNFNQPSLVNNQTQDTTPSTSTTTLQPVQFDRQSPTSQTPQVILTSRRRTSRVTSDLVNPNVPFPEEFEFPTQQLGNAFLTNLRNRRYRPTNKEINILVRVCFDSMREFIRYQPTKYQLEDAAKSIIRKFPHLKLKNSDIPHVSMH
jgi:hypothetical protein